MPAHTHIILIDMPAQREACTPLEILKTTGPRTHLYCVQKFVCIMICRSRSYRRMCTRPCMHRRMCTRPCMHRRMYTRPCMPVLVGIAHLDDPACMHVCVCVYVYCNLHACPCRHCAFGRSCMYACMHVCMYVYCNLHACACWYCILG